MMFIVVEENTNILTLENNGIHTRMENTEVGQTRKVSLYFKQNILKNNFVKGLPGAKLTGQIRNNIVCVIQKTFQ